MKKTYINLVSNIVSTIVNILIGFWLSPFIIANIGVEANGFVTLASNFIMYASLAVTALNSMAARFITIEYVKKNYKKANLYYNSVFWGNLFLVAVLLPCAILLIRYLEVIINIPSDIVFDVKLLFAFVFLNFFLQTGAPNWECGAFVANRIDRTTVPNIFINIFRCVFLFAVMTIFTPKVWYVGVASAIMMVMTLIVGRYNTHTLTPQLSIKFRKGERECSWKAIKELVGSGIWNSISSIGSLLLNGLDLLICNLFIGSTEMGVLALAKIVPSYIQNFSVTIFNAFAPEIVINYAEGDKNKLVHDLNRSMKILTFLLSIPLCGTIVLCSDFYKLWVPSQDAFVLSTITIAICSGYAITSGIQMLNSVFQTVNKVKTSSLIVILSGVVSTILVFILLNITNLGIYVIASVSVVVNLLRFQLYVIPYATKYIGVPKKPFYKLELVCLINTVLICLIGFGINSIFVANSWLLFVVKALTVSFVCFGYNFVLFLSKAERKAIKNTLGRFFRRKT